MNPQVTMCVRGCARGRACMRRQAPPIPLQAFLDFRPAKDGSCAFFWDADRVATAPGTGPLFTETGRRRQSR